MRLRPCTDPALWNTLALATPGGTGFHEWSFLDLVQGMLGVHVERLLVEADGPVGVLPFARRSRHDPRGVQLPFPFLGPAVPPALLPATLAALRRWQLRHGLVIARLDLAPSLAAAAPRDLPGFTAAADTTLVLDLSHGSVEALHAGISPSRRRSIQTALRAGAVARPAEPGESAAMLGPAVAEAYERRGLRVPYPLDAGERFEEWAAGRDDVHQVSVLVDGEHAGSTTVLGWHPVAVGWIGAALGRFRSARPGDLLYREALEWAVRHGSTGFDFAGRVDSEVSSYKRSFGGTDRPYVHLAGSLLPDRAHRVLRGGGTARVVAP